MEKSVPLPDKYLRAARRMVDKLNTGLLNVYQYISLPQDSSGLTEFTLMPTIIGLPCRLSYQDKQSTTKNEPAQALKSVRVVISSGYDIPPGSILEITFNGVTQKYKQSGRIHKNDFRQSIPLEIYEEHAVEEIYEGE